MISIDSLQTLNAVVNGRPEEHDLKMYPFEELPLPIYDALSPYPDWCNLDMMNNSFDCSYEFTKFSSGSLKADIGIMAPSPTKLNSFNILDLFVGDGERLSAPQSPDSGFGQEDFGSYEDYIDVFSYIDRVRDADCMGSLKLNNGSDIEDFLDSIADNESKDSCGAENGVYIKDPQFMGLAKLINSDYMLNESKTESLDVKPVIGLLPRIRNDSLGSDSLEDAWLTEAVLQHAEEDFNDLCESIHQQPAKKKIIVENTLKIKEEPIDDDDDDETLDVLRMPVNSNTILIEHNYFQKPSEDEEEIEEEVPVKKRKRNEVDEDFSPYQKPKRKAGRPRTNFSKAETQKSQRFKTQKAKASKRTSQASSKKLKNCSAVPHDRREQHNQAERERRDMLKKNLDIVEDATPDHVLQMTQLALQSEKTNKSDEFENNENNFTVDVLKKLDELIKREPVSHKPKYKKASRNSKMVVLLGSTYYIGSLEKELKLKESKLAQLKKKYEDSIKRLNPIKSNKKVRRNY